MNWDFLLFVLLCIFLYIYYYTHKSHFTKEGWIILRRTSLGLNHMRNLGKKSWLKKLGYVSIFLGYLGMVFMSTVLIYFTIDFVIKLFRGEAAQPAVAPLLPGIQIAPSIPAISFLHWIIIIGIIAVTHEFMHGAFAAFGKVRIKSSGFAFLGPLLGAFVEPDEKQLMKKDNYTKLSTFSAGPFANILTSMLCFLLVILVMFLLYIPPVNDALYGKYDGLHVIGYFDNTPGQQIANQLGEEYFIYSINNRSFNSMENASLFLTSTLPNQSLNFNTSKGIIEIKSIGNPDNLSKGYVGIKYEPSMYYPKFRMIIWIFELFTWLILLSVMVGLFNLLPAIPLDGGRMIEIAFESLFIKFRMNKKKATKLANKITIFISYLFLVIILIHLIPYILRLFNWIFGLL